MSEGISNNHLPPKIVELLKKRGWTWPPDEERKREMREALDRLKGCNHASRAVLKDVRAEMPGRFPEIPDEE